MVNPKAKTPNKRKSIMNTSEGSSTPSPNKVSKLNENAKTPNVKTPAKNKGNATPRNLNKTPKAGKNVAKSPKQTPALKVNKPNEASKQGASPTKLKMFRGTGQSQQPKANKKPNQNNQKADKDEKDKKKRRSMFLALKERMNSGDKDNVIKTIEQKIKDLENRKQLSKTAKRKMKGLLRMKRTVLGETVTLSPTQKRRERKQIVVAKQKAQVQNAKPNQQKQTTHDEDEESSDYEVDSEVKPGAIIKTEEGSEEEEETGDEVSGEEDSDEEESGEEEESVDEEEESSEEESEEEVEVKKISAIPQGGKKQGVEKKNEIKSKNLKLQAMRKQGQLAGGVKPNQKRAARRAKMNTAKVNGS